VAIARTLILRPQIILMDEPFGALDPHTRMQMQDLLVSLWNEVQATVFFVTHSIEEAIYLGDRVFILSRSPGTLLHPIGLQWKCSRKRHFRKWFVPSDASWRIWSPAKVSDSSTVSVSRSPRTLSDHRGNDPLYQSRIRQSLKSAGVGGRDWVHIRFRASGNRVATGCRR